MPLNGGKIRIPFYFFANLEHGATLKFVIIQCLPGLLRTSSHSLIATYPEIRVGERVQEMFFTIKCVTKLISMSRRAVMCIFMSPFPALNLCASVTVNDKNGECFSHATLFGAQIDSSHFQLCEQSLIVLINAFKWNDWFQINLISQMIQQFQMIFNQMFQPFFLCCFFFFH